MANYLALWSEEKEDVQERRELVLERIAQIVEVQEVADVYKDYFSKLASKILFMNEILKLGEQGKYTELSLKELQDNNEALYAEFREGAYETNYANPAYAVAQFGEEYGVVLAMIYTRIANLAPMMITGVSHMLVIYAELFVQIYNRFEENDFEGTELKKIINEFYHDYVEYFVEHSTRAMLDVNYDYYTNMIDTADLNDIRYLYFYGLHITENEIKTAEFFHGIQIVSMAKC